MGFSLEELKKLKESRGLTTRSTEVHSLDNLKAKSNGGGISNLNARINNLSKKEIANAGLVLKERTMDIVFILDCSSSCSGTEPSTINSFREFIVNEQKKPYLTYVTTVLFNQLPKVMHDRLDISVVKPFDYRAEGTTALYDTICNRIYKLQIAHMLSKEKNIKTLFVIMTDGEDNSSTYFNCEDTKRLINEMKSKGWEFILLAANQNAKLTALKLGIDIEKAETYLQNSSGISLNFKAISKVINDMRQIGEISSDWSSDIIKNNVSQDIKQLEEKDNKVKRIGY